MLVGVFTFIYAVSFAGILAVEFYAIGNPRRGDTVSEHAWAIRRTTFVWAFIPALTWVFCHLVLPWEPDGRIVNDLVYIAAGFVLALWNVTYRARHR